MASVPFLICLLTPVLIIIDSGRAAREAFGCLVVRTTVSFLPLVSDVTSRTCLFARPLNLNELRPQRFPGSAFITGTPTRGLLRMKEEFFFTHSHTSAGAAIAGSKKLDRRGKGTGAAGAGEGDTEP